MRYWKSSAAAVMAVALSALAFAATASATTVTDSSGGTTPTIHMVQEVTQTQKHVTLHNSIVNIECQMTLEGKVQSHGSGVTTALALTTFSIVNCTNEWVFDVVSKGSLEIHYKEAGSGHGVGTVTWTGATLTSTRSGLSCHYRTNNTHLGTIIGGTPATLTIEASIPRHGGSFLCGGSTTKWTGSFVTTSTLKIDP